LIGRDPSTDIALLRIEDQEGPAVSLSGTDGCRIGQLAIVVGRRPEGLSAAFGMTSFAGGPWQSMRGGRIDRRLELDLRLNPRLEGGAALDPEGRIAGMAVLGPHGRVLVIPSETIERVAQQLLAHGRIARGYIGLGVQPVRIDQAAMSAQDTGTTRGLMIISVDPEGPGQTADLRQGDVIVRWNGEPLQRVRDLFGHLGSGSVGQSAELEILRAGERLPRTVQIGERAMPR
jgi:S1-C subfamily serine protease